MINYSVSWTSKPADASAVKDRLALGLSKHTQGHLDAAIADYVGALQERPLRVVACYNLGVALIDSGFGLAAIPLLRRVLLQQPSSPTFRAALIYALLRAGRRAEAERLIGEAGPLGIAADTLSQWRAWVSDAEPAQAPPSAPLPAGLAYEPPDTPLALPAATAAQSRLGEPFSHAVKAYQAGRFEEALQLLDPHLSELPSWGEGYHLQGLASMSMRRFEQAAAALARAAELVPGRADLWDHLGVAYARAPSAGDASAAFEQSLTLSPLRAETWNNAADAALRRGDLMLAFQLAFQAARLNPKLRSASYSTLQAAYKLQEAVKGRGQSPLDLATALVTQHAETPEDAIELTPMLAQLGLFEAVVTILERAIGRSERPAPELLDLLVRYRRHQCDWRDLAAGESTLLELARSGASAPRLDPFSAIMVEAYTPEDLLQIARKRSEDFRPWVARAWPRPDASAMAQPLGRRVRVGYVSGDFRDHATAYLTASLFERHDRRRFEVFAYSTRPDDGGPTRQRLKAAIEHFVDIETMGHAQAAQRIRDDGIDILVDLEGYTSNAALEVFALRPSPVQVTWLGFPGGLGAPFIDYIIADPVVIPPEHAVWYDEEVAYLPDVYAPVDDRRTMAATPRRADLGLPEDAFVFCCFNDPYKITPSVFDCWCELLSEVEGSVLWLYARGDATQANLRREAQGRGVDPGRLVFADKLPQPEHLARIAVADLFLDTRPVNAHTTASDALWAGLPLLTCPGETFASRVAASLLTAVGAEELIVPDMRAYKAKALALAAEPEQLAALRHRLVEARATAPLFDTERFTRNLEGVYDRLWALGHSHR